MNRSLTCVVTLAAAVAFGENMQYKSDGSATNAWSTAANWYDATGATPLGRAPTSADNARIGALSGVTTVEIAEGTSAQVATLTVGENAGQQNRVLLSGGSLTSTVSGELAKGLTLGKEPGTAGVFEMTGGDLNLTSSQDWGLRVGDRGYGKFTVTGGTLDFSGANAQIQIGMEAGSFGEATFAGGKFASKNTAYLGVQNGATGVLHVTGSTIAQQNWTYYVGQIGRGILEIDHAGDAYSGAPTGFLPFKLIVGGDTRHTEYDGSGRVVLKGQMAINWWAGAHDDRGIYVGNSGDGEFVSSARTLYSNIICVGGRKGAKLTLEKDSRTEVYYLLEIGRCLGDVACPGEMVIDGGEVYFYEKHADDPAVLKIGGVSEASGGGILRGCGKFSASDPDSQRLPVGIGYGGRVVAAGGVLDMSGMADVYDLCPVSGATTNGWYVDAGSSIRFPRMRLVDPQSGQIEEPRTFGIGCPADEKGPSLAHACTATLTGAWQNTAIHAELHDHLSEAVPEGFPIADEVLGVWKFNYSWNHKDGVPSAPCTSFTLKFRLTSADMRSSKEVVVYRSTGSGWAKVEATYDAATQTVMVETLTPDDSGSVNLGWFAIGRIKSGSVLFLR